MFFLSTKMNRFFNPETLFDPLTFICTLHSYVQAVFLYVYFSILIVLTFFRTKQLHHTSLRCESCYFCYFNAIWIQNRHWITHRMTQRSFPYHRLKSSAWSGSFWFRLLTLIGMTQCARTDLNKRFLPKPMATTGWKGTT